jgi:eukaryotic-like serine/threonine-protein kinase
VVEPARRSLGNRYELRGLLASGGMGQVWRAEDTLLGRPVAVKVLRSEYTGDPLFLARFRAEAQHAAALSHPNIAAVYDYGEEPAIDGSGEHLAYLVMELVEGESLSVVLAREGTLSPNRTLDVLRQTALALAVAHAAGVVHRDVKPGNVLVRRDGAVKITDFGIAWSAGSVPLTQTGQVVGTASYLSPEQAAGAHATAASDVYALGMVGYECLAGRRAFDGDNSVTIALRHLRDQPDPLPAEVPAGVRTLIERATVKDPTQRFPDGAAVVEAIDELRAGRVLAPVQHTDTQSFWLLPDAAALAGAAPATGASPTAGGRAPGGARGRAGRMLVPLAALLVGAGLAALVLQAVTPTAPAPTAATVEVTGTATPSAEPILVEPADFVGRPVDAVRAQLEALGLVVQLQEVRDRDADPGTVVDVAPLSARLEPGQTVLVSYAVASQSRNSATTRAPRVPADSVAQTSDEATETPTPSVTATPTPTPTPTPTDTPTPTPTATPTTSASDTTAPDDDEDDDWDDEETDTPDPTSTPTGGTSPDGGTLR